MVTFAGWDMPVQFSSVVAEHTAVRQGVGLFDISHMGPFWMTGPGARASLQKLVTNDVSSLAPGRGLYALLCRDNGTVLDDLYIYCVEKERFLVIVNASRATVDFPWMKERLLPQTDFFEQPQPAAFAVQGPRAAALFQKLVPASAGLVKNDVIETSVFDRELVVARTGYTGEDGFEVFGAAGHVFPLYQALCPDVTLCGLGARDTLRLEMGYRLYGHDLDEHHTALEAGLGWAVKLGKGDFVGAEALRKEKETGSRHRFIGFTLKERGVPREGCSLSWNGTVVGAVTSGTFSPSLQRGIGLGYVNASLFPAQSQGSLTVLIHGRPFEAGVVVPPFLKGGIGLS